MWSQLQIRSNWSAEETGPQAVLMTWLSLRLNNQIRRVKVPVLVFVFVFVFALSVGPKSWVLGASLSLNWCKEKRKYPQQIWQNVHIYWIEVLSPCKSQILFYFSFSELSSCKKSRSEVTLEKQCNFPTPDSMRVEGGQVKTCLKDERKSSSFIQRNDGTFAHEPPACPERTDVRIC